MVWLLVLVGCADPALVPFRDAARAYDAGRSALDAGDYATANSRFAAARVLDPSSAALPLWQGRALAAEDGKLRFLKKPFSLAALHKAIDEVTDLPLFGDYESRGGLKT